MNLFKYLIWMAVALISCGLSSCIWEKYTDEDGEDIPYIPMDQTILRINMKSINAGISDNKPSEKIKSLRIVIVSLGNEETQQPDIIELNRTINIPEISASGLDYTITWPTKATNKSLYVIANEEYIKNNDEPITSILDEYEENGEAGDFEQWLQSFSFEPDYSSSGDAVYLPYTYHKENFTPLKGEVTEVKAWLIPVATKFIFNFVNYRSAQVNVKGVSLAYANQSNYLIANIPQEEQYLQFDTQEYYWIDWLAKVSEESWNNTGSLNEGFNLSTGWIYGYKVPDPNDAHVVTFISKEIQVLKGTEETKTVDGVVVSEIIPYKVTTDNYYLPESVNYIVPGDGRTGEDENNETGETETPAGPQTFYLTFELEDTNPGSVAPELKNLAIPNLSALFRNTYVRVTLSFREGDIEVYAEIEPWNKKSINGWVSEGEAPSSKLNLRKR